MRQHHFSSSYVTLLLAFLLFSCSEDVQQVAECPVKFSFSEVPETRAGGPQLKAFGGVTPTSIVISIENSSGDLVYENDTISLSLIGGVYQSNGISLLVGTYSVTKFVVMDSAGNDIYAVPVENTPLAYLVSDPLPVSFSVTEDVVSQVVLEVITTEERIPEEFGYASFSIEEVAVFDFLITAFKHNAAGTAWELTTADINITGDGGEELYASTLQAITNQILVESGHSVYTVNVFFSSFSYTATFTEAELSAKFDSPLLVFLQ